MWFARRRCGQLGNACCAVVCSAAVRSALQSVLRCGLLGGGVFSLEMRVALWCARRRCAQLSNASCAAVCFAAVRSA
eukprot:gene25560-biopygen6014